MSQFIDSMHVCRSRTGGAAENTSWDPGLTLENPSWDDVENAVQRLDQTHYTAVELHRSGDEPEQVFCVIGGAGQWYLVDSKLRWEFDDPNGGEEFVMIWVDKDMECKRRHLLTDQEEVLRITKRFYETGSFHDLDAVE